MIVVVFTTSYPYDYINEKTFHGGEMLLLQKYFERVIYVPRHAEGNLQVQPGQLEVDDSFSKLFSRANLLKHGLYSLFTMPFYQDIKARFPTSLSPGYLRRLISFLAGAYFTQKWVSDWFKRQQVSDKDVVFYTFWFDEISMGIGLSKKIYPDLKLITKAHGYDVYEEIYKPWPCRRLAISLLDCIFADSEIGNAYFHEKYPEYKDRYAVSLLGVPDPGAVSKPSSDEVLRIVSCSTTAPLKRLNLIIDGIAVAAQKRPQQKIEWKHFGDGPDRDLYIQRAEDMLPENAKAHFPGYSSSADLIQNYLNQPVDVFINVSSTEGTSVAMMEAISCGMPVIATAVGGNVEVAREKNGFLLNANPTPDEIADALLSVCDHRAEWLKKRQGSREVWRERYNETTNFEAFAQTLVEIRKR